MTVNADRLKLLYEAVSGVPALIVTMHPWRTQINPVTGHLFHDATDETLWNATENLLSGVSAHPFTWASLHPQMKDEGLYTDIIQMNGRHVFAPGFNNKVGIPAFAEFLGLNEKSVSILALPPLYAFLRTIKANQKQCFLFEVDLLLLQHRLITHSRYEHLIKEIYAS